MKNIVKRMSSFIIVLTIVSMFTTSLFTNATSDSIEPVSPNSPLSLSQTLQANDMNSSFSVHRNNTQGDVSFQNQLSSPHYVSLTITAISSSGTTLGVIPYNGVLGGGMSYSLSINQPNTASWQVSAKMLNGTTSSGTVISDWSATMSITNNSIIIQGDDGSSIVTLTKNSNYVVISLKNITSNTYFTRLNITEVTSTGVIVNSTSHNNNLPSNISYTLIRPNTANTFQLTGQMWNNTAPTGTLLSNWTATA